VTEVQSEDIGSGVEQRFNGFAARARGTQRSDNFGISIAAHL
jgi:hypothetical protein